MPRSHCENENVQFVQELAEVDGPFESPININFRDLTKLELPSLVWNKNETCPKKMKISNTGHTVIINGKWTCERPYICGGPLLGKYVFSQIHFHWGHDDCVGSEHQVCDEKFPLEMHVAHYKADYLNQENALREKDGMVILVYLFKLQEEPNESLKKIINKLPSVKPASTSQPIDPRPILSICNPFTDDYFMYWGSVVTPTCAHILLWIVCREPFGISKEQVNEFRKLCDFSQKPICHNSRDIQPLHKRNVFHVNASKNLTDALLPIKKVIGCYCKGSGEKVNINKPKNIKENPCACQPPLQNQEDIEGRNVDFKTGCQHEDFEAQQLVHCGPRQSGFVTHQSIIVQSATVHSALLLLPKTTDSTNLKNLYWNNPPETTKSDLKENFTSPNLIVSMGDLNKLSRSDHRKFRDRKKPLNSMIAFTHILSSLEAFKNHTFKKLKEIESINHEIKQMKPLCKVPKDKKWFRRIEKIISRKKQFTSKRSRGYFEELKKLARDCNVDKLFDNKAILTCNNNRKMLSFNIDYSPAVKPPVCLEPDAVINGTQAEPNDEKTLSKSFKFSQTLIQSFFEQVQENEDFQKSQGSNLDSPRLTINRSLCGKSIHTRDSTSVVSLAKGCITQKMFTLGNLEDRFFAEVVNDEEALEGETENTKALLVVAQESSAKESFTVAEKTEICVDTKVSEMENLNCEEIIPLHKANIEIGFTDILKKKTEQRKIIMKSKNNLSLPETLSDVESRIFSDSGSVYNSRKVLKPYTVLKTSKKSYFKKSMENCSRRHREDFRNKMTTGLDLHRVSTTRQNSITNLSTDSSETQRMIITKLYKCQSGKSIRKRKTSMTNKMYFKDLSDKVNQKKHKLRNVNFEGYYVRKRSSKNNEMSHLVQSSSGDSSFNGLSEIKDESSKSRGERLTRAKLKLEIHNSDSSLDSEMAYNLSSVQETRQKPHYLKTSIIRASDDNERTPSSNDSPQLLISSKTSNDLYVNTQIIPPPQRKKGKVTDVEVGMTDIDENKYKESEKSKKQVSPRRNVSEGTTTEIASPNRKSRKTSLVDLTKNESTQYDDSSEAMTIEEIHSEKSKSDNDNTNLTNANILNTKLTEYIHKSSTSCIENVKDKQKKGRESSELRLGSLQNDSLALLEENIEKVEEKNENVKKSENNEMSEAQRNKPQEFDVKFFNGNSSSLCDDQLLLNESQFQEGKCKSLLMKRCHVEKHRFLDKELKESKSSENASLLEEARSQGVVHRSDSNVSFAKDRPTMKGDADLPKTEHKDLTPYVSYLSVRNNPQSKPHSAESLNSMKVVKRKRKKRPHCCKRNSRHYFRKTPSVFKKSNQLEHNTSRDLRLEEEKQLELISVNLTKFLRKKLAEHKRQSTKVNNEITENNEKVETQQLQIIEEKTSNAPAKEPEVKEKDEQVVKLPKNNRNRGRIPKFDIQKALEMEKKSTNENPNEKKNLNKPVHNFIKLNKLNAGKYKRTTMLPVRETVPITPAKETDEIPKKKDEPKNAKNKPKTLKKEDKPSAPKAGRDAKATTNISSHIPKKATTARPNSVTCQKENKDKKPVTPKKPASANSKLRKGSIPLPIDKLRNRQSGQKVSPSTSLVLQKVLPPKNHWVPAYMLTSYLPTPIEIVTHQQLKMNRYLLNMNRTNFLNEILHEKNITNLQNENNTTDLEYLIKLQMSLNNEVPANLENSMTYMKTLLSKEYEGPSLVEETPNNETCNNIVVINVNDALGPSSSGSDVAEEQGKCILYRDTSDGKNKSTFNTSEITNIKISKESGDCANVKPTVFRELEGQDEYNSDSSYNCEISITLNAGSSEETDKQIYDPVNHSSEILDSFIKDIESNSSQPSPEWKGEQSKSILSRTYRKKRKENEISREMKQKLLEILEAEIKREMSVRYTASSDNLSDTLKGDDSDAINRSQSTESSCDNIELLAQISETMRQYLSVYKEKIMNSERTRALEKKRKDKEA